MSDETQAKVVLAVKELQSAMTEFIRHAPKFENDGELAGNIGRKLANLETVLHWDCGVWELALPKLL